MKHNSNLHSYFQDVKSLHPDLVECIKKNIPKEINLDSINALQLLPFQNY